MLSILNEIDYDYHLHLIFDSVKTLEKFLSFVKRKTDNCVPWGSGFFFCGFFVKEKSRFEGKFIMDAVGGHG
jgi:hypothetical protein